MLRKRGKQGEKRKAADMAAPSPSAVAAANASASEDERAGFPHLLPIPCPSIQFPASPTLQQQQGGTRGSSLFRTPYCSVEEVLEKDDFLVPILRRVAAATGSYQHALVCRRWLALSPSVQPFVRVRRLNEISEAALVREIKGFPALARIHLHQSVPRLTDFFLGALGSHHSSLRHLELSGRVYWANDDTTGEGWRSLFENLPSIRTLTYSGIRKAAIIESLTMLTALRSFKAEDVTSLPGCLGSLTSLQSLCILGNWDSSTTLPESVSQLRRLRELTFHSGSLVPLPDEVGHLTALTTLSLELYHAVTVPDSLARLTRLQTLRFEVCLELIALPPGLGSLSRLRTLRLSCCPRIRFIPPSLIRASITDLEIRACPLLASLR